MFHFNVPAKKVPTGFSLIELMVVMAIISVLMGLTGGLVTKTVSQQERQVELEKVKHLFKQLSYRAFYEGEAFDVKLQENTIIIKKNEVSKELKFKQLTFVAQDFVVTTRAVVSPASFGVFWKGSPRYFNVGSLFESYEIASNE
jgi:prepilin-type N-terminal cleavage/methylation domain-containing protein